MMNVRHDGLVGNWLGVVISIIGSISNQYSTNMYIKGEGRRTRYTVSRRTV